MVLLQGVMYPTVIVPSHPLKKDMPHEGTYTRVEMSSEGVESGILSRLPKTDIWIGN